MDHRISYRTVTHVVEVRADEILEASGAQKLPDDPYVQWCNLKNGFTGVMISWSEEVHD